MKKKKLSLNKETIAVLSKAGQNKIVGGETLTQLTCMATCNDPNSIDLCELSEPCYNTFAENCHTAGGNACN